MERFLRGFSHDFESTSSRTKYTNCLEHFIPKTGKCLVNAVIVEVESSGKADRGLVRFGDLEALAGIVAIAKV